MTSALTKFAEQTSVQLLYSAKLAENLSAHAVNGQYTSNQALAVLLEGSGISYHYVDKNVITLEKSPQKAPEQLNKVGPTTLKPVNVTATAFRDVKDPYNEDYVLPSATAGTKTDTPIMETPLNVQVVSKQVMKDQQVISLADSLKNVSGVSVIDQGDNSNDIANGRGGQTNVVIRGFESSTYFRNGFRLQQGNREMSNVESVEVLKGPAAILYGLVEPGGMVNVVTKQPLATPYYALNQQFGSYDNYRTTVDASGPIASNKDVLYRFNMSYQNSGSWQDYVGKDDVFMAPVLKWNISPKTKVTAEFEYNRLHQGQSTSFNPYINGQLAKLPLSRNYGAYSPLVDETFFGGVNWSHQFNNDWAIKQSFSVNQQSFTANNYRLPDFTIDGDTLTGIFGIPAGFSGLRVLRETASSRNQNNTYSTNLDLTGHFDTFGLNHTLLLGGDYYRLNYDSKSARIPSQYEFNTVDIINPVNPGLPLDLSQALSGDYQQQFDQYGLYAQDQIKLPYDVHVTGGLRYQNLHQKTMQTGLDITSVFTAKSQDAVTPRVGILWHPQSWVSLYANYAESFGANTGTVWIGPGQFKPIAPTSATQYEGGIKTEFFDGRLRATLAYYDLTKTNVAVSDPTTHDCGGGAGSCSIALGAIRSRGPELDFQGEILPGWNAVATYANTDITVTKTNANNDVINYGGGSYAVGNRLLNVPRNTASFWNTYEFQDTALKGLKFGGGVTVREGQIGSGGTTFDGNPYPVIKTPGYATLDFMTAYSRAIGKSKITVQFNINNLLDKRYFTSINALYNDPTNQLFSAQSPYGAPRTMMGSINIQY